jgi:hypothetical protein
MPQMTVPQRNSSFHARVKAANLHALVFVMVLVAASSFAAASSSTNQGQINVVSSSHQDTAWMDSPAACRKFRIDDNIMPALEMMRKDPNYTFCMECALHLMEFLEAHPELRDEVITRMKEGRLEFGGTYNQPYESWFSGEDLIRETYYGRRWIRRNLPGCDARVAFNPDPPARSLQMQQILAKAGIPYMFISRYHEGLYRWNSPDGTGVLLFTPGHYGNHMFMLGAKQSQAMAAISNHMVKAQAYHQKRQLPPEFCLINSQDFSKPADFSPLIHAWNSQKESNPVMRYSSIFGFFDSIDKPEAKFDTRMGERPDVWLYITGPTHHWTSSLKREAAHILPAAETFTTFEKLLSGSMRDWPTAAFDKAWMDEIYIDHGIGGQNGHITDEVFHRKAQSALEAGRGLLNNALVSIAAQVKPSKVRGTPITVFNTLSWARTDPVEMDLPSGITESIHVVDDSGKEVPSQFTTVGLAVETNIAAGVKATASSVFSAEYAADKAVDGRWNVQDPNPETGSPAKWNSGPGDGPHWLMLDFGKPQSVHKVVIRHEGVLGVFGGETKYNTADFRIESAEDADGPWTDVEAPITGNVASLTVHTFAPRTMRLLRVTITKGAQSDDYARIYEVQAFARITPAPRLLFMAEDVPALGYKTFHLVPGGPKPGKDDALQNEFYRVELVPGGIKSLYDKQLKRELLNTSKFLGGEVFTMLSVAPDNRGAGTDAGEFGSIPMPMMDESFDRISKHKPQWKQIEAGPVRTVFELVQPLKNTTVRQRAILWHPIKRVDCEVDLTEFNGELWREFRMALPLAMEKPKLAYEVPLGVVEIGKDEIPGDGGHAYGNLNYTDQCRSIHPRLVQDFVNASDANGGLMMSSSVSVFDWVDPTTDPVPYPVLQPVLLASRKSCNGAGNWYPQAGDHHYRFPVTSQTGGWQGSWREGIAANRPLIPVLAKPGKTATLPSEKSFASVSAPNVLVSTIKKCEDDDSMIVRCYDMEGKDSVAQLNLFRPIASAKQANIIEDEGAALPADNGAVRISIGHHSIETIKLQINR